MTQELCDRADRSVALCSCELNQPFSRGTDTCFCLAEYNREKRRKQIACGEEAGWSRGRLSEECDCLQNLIPNKTQLSKWFSIPGVCGAPRFQPCAQSALSTCWIRYGSHTKKLTIQNKNNTEEYLSGLVMEWEKSNPDC